MVLLIATKNVVIKVLQIMVSKQLAIINKLGLHARAATKLVNLAARYAAESTITKGDKTINAKSIMGLMMLAATKGTTITLTCEGEDEVEAFSAIEHLINNRFDEPE